LPFGRNWENSARRSVWFLKSVESWWGKGRRRGVELRLGEGLGVGRRQKLGELIQQVSMVLKKRRDL
jgi:hypothetical protein